MVVGVGVVGVGVVLLLQFRQYGGRGVVGDVGDTRGEALSGQGVSL